MKLTDPVITSIDSLLSVLDTLGIEKLIIEPGKIRAIDERKTLGTITNQNVPDLSGKTLAVSRVKALKARISLAKAQGPVAITASFDQSGNSVTMLEVAAGRSKSQFRCASADAVKVPKTFNDKPAFEVLISNKLIPLLSQADAAMATDAITIASKDATAVTLELVDSNKDVYTFDVEKPATSLNPGKTANSFVFKYPSKALTGLLKEAAKTATDEVKLSVGEQGILLIDVGGYQFFTLPQA